MTRGILIAVLWAVVLVSACKDNDDPDLEKNVVTNLPEGNASGNRANGNYRIEMYTSDCDGDCGPVGNFPFSASLCDIGDEDITTIEVKQIDGYLEIRDLQGYIVSRLSGGIDRDGSFDVGGYGTENGGEVRSTARARGKITESGEFHGDAHAQTEGNYDGDHVNCRASYSVTGEKI